MTLVQNDDLGQRNMRIAACVLIGAGIASGVGNLLFALAQEFAGNFWWNATATILLLAFRADPLRCVARVAGSLMLLLWFFFNITGLIDFAEAIAGRLEDPYLGFMLLTAGLLMLLANDPQGRTGVLLRRWSSFCGARRKAVLAVAVLGLWTVNPGNSHSICLSASDFCERRGAYGWAVTFTELARDTFPKESFCATCQSQFHNELSSRIARLTAYQKRVPARPQRPAYELPVESHYSWRRGPVD